MHVGVQLNYVHKGIQLSQAAAKDAAICYNHGTTTQLETASMQYFANNYFYLNALE